MKTEHHMQSEPRKVDAVTTSAVRAVRFALAKLHDLTCLLILLVMFWIVSDVVGRLILNRPLPNTRELVSYLLPIIVFLQIGYILLQDRHLRSPILTDRVGIKTRAVLGLLRDTLGALLFAVATYASFPDAWTALHTGLQYGSASVALSVGPARLVIVFGSALMAGIFFARIARQLLSLLQSTRSRT